MAVEEILDGQLVRGAMRQERKADHSIEQIATIQQKPRVEFLQLLQDGMLVRVTVVREQVSLDLILLTWLLAQAKILH
jgi:hypothetical protein